MSGEKRKLIVVAHNIRSAHNVGSIFRTAEGAGAEKIILTGYTPVPVSDEKKKFFTRAEKDLAKTALRAEKNVPWEKNISAKRVIRKLRKQGYEIVALEKSDDSTNLFSFEPKFPCALVLGNEVVGVSSDLLEICDAVIHIPMRGKKESLNVSVAAGIAIYAILK